VIKFIYLFNILVLQDKETEVLSLLPLGLFHSSQHDTFGMYNGVHHGVV